MNDAVKERFFRDIKKQNMRMTKPRKAMLSILDSKHLTFKDLQTEMIRRGYLNVATMYNTLEFLLEQKVVNELFHEGDKYYELALTNPNHDVSHHIHFIDAEKKEISEIYAPEILQFISNFDELKNINISSIKIMIEGTKK